MKYTRIVISKVDYILFDNLKPYISGLGLLCETRIWIFGEILFYDFSCIHFLFSDPSIKFNFKLKKVYKTEMLKNFIIHLKIQTKFIYATF